MRATLRTQPLVHIDALDIVTWDMTATGGASYRRQDLICRWELPVRVYLAQ